jgi:hypothetical protein
LPGGFGTMEEFCEAPTWSQLGLHHKPLGLLNAAGFYDSLPAFFDHAVNGTSSVRRSANSSTPKPPPIVCSICWHKHKRLRFLLGMPLARARLPCIIQTNMKDNLK